MDNFWSYVGIALIAWVGWDLYAGYTLLHKTVYLAEQPGLYWAGIVTWSLLALSCFTGEWQSTED